MSMTILLTGKNWQVGFELQRALAPLGEIVAVDHQKCDLADPAANNAVDKPESKPELAQAINATVPGIFGQEAAHLGPLVVHHYTDYVFDGSKQGAYRKDDTHNPQSVYGKTKLAGEKALQRRGADHLIFLTSWVFGAHGGNLAKTMLRLAAELLKRLVSLTTLPQSSRRTIPCWHRVWPTRTSMSPPANRLWPAPA